MVGEWMEGRAKFWAAVMAGGLSDWVGRYDKEKVHDSTCYRITTGIHESYNSYREL